MPIPSTPHTESSRTLLRDEVLEHLTVAILDGRLAPGERLRDQELSTWLQVSRTPIREALSKLVNVGLVSLSPNRFTKVAEVDLEVLCESTRALGVLVGGVLLSDSDAWEAAGRELPEADLIADGDGVLEHFWGLTSGIIVRGDSASLEDAYDSLKMVVQRDFYYGRTFIDVDRYRAATLYARGSGESPPDSALAAYREMAAVIVRGCAERVDREEMC